MATADLQAPAFTDETVARAAMEAVLWPNGPVCPRCGALDKIGTVSGQSARPGLYYCGHCKRQFTVTVGTIFERSKVPLTRWWLAIHLISSSKKGISSHQLHRMLGVTYQTAWFMSHRIREAMKQGGPLAPLGGEGSVIEADETCFGRHKGMPKPKGSPKRQMEKTQQRLAPDHGSGGAWRLSPFVPRGRDQQQDCQGHARRERRQGERADDR